MTALVKVTYTDNVTVIGAQNLNNIQDHIIALEDTATLSDMQDIIDDYEEEEAQ